MFAHYQTVTAKSEDDLQLTLLVLNANYVDYRFKIYVMTFQEMKYRKQKTYWQQSNGTNKRSDYLRCSISYSNNNYMYNKLHVVQYICGVVQETFHTSNNETVEIAQDICSTNAVIWV